jgi:hypothetical protein
VFETVNEPTVVDVNPITRDAIMKRRHRSFRVHTLNPFVFEQTGPSSTLLSASAAADDTNAIEDPSGIEESAPSIFRYYRPAFVRWENFRLFVFVVEI